MGVYKRGKKYVVKVSERNQQRWLGTFDDKDRADSVYGAWLQLKRAPERMTFADLAYEWLSGIQVRERTWRDYVTTCDQLIQHFNDRPICDIRPKDVDHFVSASALKYEPNTVRKQVTRLRQILRQAVRWGYIPSSPAAGRLSLPRVQKRVVVPLNPEQAWRLVDAAEPYYRPLFLMALTTGLRQSELFGLKWRDLDLTGGTVTVRQTMYEGSLEPTKSDAANRTIDLPQTTVEALRAHENVCPQTKEDLVFPAPWGRYLNTKTFSQYVMIPTANKAGLPWVRLHDLRHCYASLMIHSGQSAKYVQSVMGHGTIGITYDTYGHLFPGEGKQAASKMESWLGSVAESVAANGTESANVGSDQ